MTGSVGETGWERLFWMVFDSTSNPVVLLDDKRHIIRLNDAALRLLGGDRDARIGTSLGDSVLPAEQQRAAAEWKLFLHSGEYSGTRELVRADGSIVLVEFAARLAEIGGARRAIYVLMPRDGHSTSSAAGLSLTNREREIVMLIAMGRDTAEIAVELHVSPETVRSHVRNAMRKLDVHTRAQLVAVVLCADEALGTLAV
jgi:PAS domain S-box-containing protein